MQKLYETHMAVSPLSLPDEGGGSIPESHTTARAHIEIVLDGEGNFKRAIVIDKTDATTCIPCTQASGTRAGSKPVPHPLCDSLQYLAADFRAHGGEVTSGFAADDAQPRSGFLEQLQKWVDASPHPKTQAISAYVRRGGVIKDLVAYHALPVDAGGRLAKSKEVNSEGQHPIWSVLAASQLPENAVVRWRVEIPGELASGVWEDQSLLKNWAAYYPMTIEGKGLCMICGEEAALASLHPAKLRHAGDKAKLISSNDSSGFTFRGRFTDSNGLQACGVGYEVSQKAHNTLRWLIARQGYRNGSQVFVSWAVSSKPIPPPLHDSYDWLDEPVEIEGEAPEEADVALNHARDQGQSFALRLQKYMKGYRENIAPTEDIVILGLDSATTGRMSIIYYRELLGSEFLDRLESWHQDMAWPQRRSFTEQAEGRKKGKTRVVWQAYAPSPRAVAEAAYGRRLDDKLKRATVERLLPCIVEKRALPRDLVESAVGRAANRIGMEHWEWEQALGVACALFKGFWFRHQNPEQRRTYDMALEPDCTSRDYLYGRLLAAAEHIESIALNVAGEKRPTTAARLMQRFADHPCSTWRTIELALQPYMQRLQARRGGFLHNMRALLDELFGLFQGEDFQCERRLTGEFLLGYHCQRLVWKKDKNNSAETEGEE